MTEPKTCFVICPIGEPGSETRKRSDQVLKHVIKPASEDCGYNAIRADEIDKPGLITSQVIQHIVDDELVIADLTDRNPNVFYELAIRHAIRKPLVQIIHKGEQIPFDVAGTRTIYVDHKDLDSVSEAKQEIINQIKSLENDSDDIETPISISLELQLFRQSENPEDRSFADVLSILSEIKGDLNKLRVRSSNEIDEQLQILLFDLKDRLSMIGDQGPRRSRVSKGVSSRFLPKSEAMQYAFRDAVGSGKPEIGLLIVSDILRTD